MSKPEILAVANVHPLYLKALKEVFQVHERAHEGDPAVFAEMAPRIVGIAAGGESMVSRSLLEQLPNLKLVSVFGVGYDGIDAKAAVERGVMVTHTPGVLSDDVADLAMGLVLAVSRQIVQADQHVRHGRWPQGPMPLGRKVSGSRMGIVGLGRIGAAIARLPLICRWLTPPVLKSQPLVSSFIPQPSSWLRRSIFWWSSHPAVRAPGISSMGLFCPL